MFILLSNVNISDNVLVHPQNMNLENLFLLMQINLPKFKSSSRRRKNTVRVVGVIVDIVLIVWSLGHRLLQ